MPSEKLTNLIVDQMRERASASVQDWLIKNLFALLLFLIVLIVLLAGGYFVMSKVDTAIMKRNAELRGQFKQDLADAQQQIKDAVALAEKNIKEAKEAEGKTDGNAAAGRSKADAAAKKKMADMVNDWNK